MQSQFKDFITVWKWLKCGDFIKVPELAVFSVEKARQLELKFSEGLALAVLGCSSPHSRSA